MGLFDFVKSVGKKLGIGDEESPDADALKKELDSYDLGTEKVEVAVEGDKAVVKGEVANQSIFEKTIIAVGNTWGVSKVEGGELKVSDPAGPNSRSWQPLERPITFGTLLKGFTARARGRITRKYLKPTNRC